MTAQPGQRQKTNKPIKLHTKKHTSKNAQKNKPVHKPGHHAQSIHFSLFVPPSKKTSKEKEKNIF